MRGYWTREPLPGEAIRALGATDPLEQLKAIIAASLPQGESPVLKRVELYYIRQVNGRTADGHGIVYYWTPEFAYLVDIGYPRLPLIALPYEVPTEKVPPMDYRTVGRGDAEFPEFKEAALFSAAGSEPGQILRPATAKVLLIGVKDGVPEDRVKAALKPYVEAVERQGAIYVAKVHAFRETEIATKIEKEVDVVRYAELSGIVRDGTAPWFVDRVL